MTSSGIKIQLTHSSAQKKAKRLKRALQSTIKRYVVIILLVWLLNYATLSNSLCIKITHVWEKLNYEICNVSYQINIGICNVHELFWMRQCNLTKISESTFFILNVEWVFVQDWVLWYINKNVKHSPESILMLFFTFPCLSLKHLPRVFLFLSSTGWG